jgi:hypothetical protein
MISRSGLRSIPPVKGIELIPVGTLKEAISKGIGQIRRKTKDKPENTLPEEAPEDLFG